MTIQRDAPQSDAVPSHDPPGGRHYVAELVSELSTVIPSRLNDPENLPPGFEFRLAPVQFRSILGVSSALLEADWPNLPQDIINEVPQALTQLLRVVRDIERFPFDASIEVRDQLEAELEAIQTFFGEKVEPAVESVKKMQSHPPENERERTEAKEIREALKAAQVELAALQAKNEDISAELESRSALVEARRDESGSSGATKLALAYAEQAQRHTTQWRYWGCVLVGTLVLAIAAGLLLLKINHLPDDAKTAQIVSHVTLDLLIVGLLIYAVRIASLQFSVHRHLAAVSESKAAALLTFSRILSAGSDPETRTTMAGVLAQSVFSSDHTGFIASSSDQITLIERLAGTVSQRTIGGE